MQHLRELPPEDEAALVAVADGSAEPPLRLRARLDADPDLAAALERQRTAVALVRDTARTTSAPVRLRAALERQAAATSGPRVRRPGRRGWWWAGLATAGAAAALLLAVVLPAGGLTVPEAVAAGERPAAAGAPAAAGRLLRLDADGVPFPNYAEPFGWRATGRRDDELDGRRVRTVFYERAGAEVAYSIVSGDPLNPPGGRRSVRGGVELRTLAVRGRAVVTWERLGRTCVLSARGVEVETLLELAAWRGKGEVPF